MVVGIERLRAAGDLLRRNGDDESRTLLDGALEVWSAMLDMSSWPLALSAKSVELQTTMFRYGPIRTTVQQMSEPERLRLRRELLAFIDFAECFEATPAGDEMISNTKEAR